MIDPARIAEILGVEAKTLRDLSHALEKGLPKRGAQPDGRAAVSGTWRRPPLRRKGRPGGCVNRRHA